MVPSLSPNPDVSAMKMMPAGKYSADPSMLMVAPMETTNRDKDRDTCLVASTHRMVTGKVAMEDAQPNANTCAGIICLR